MTVIYGPCVFDERVLPVTLVLRFSISGLAEHLPKTQTDTLPKIPYFAEKRADT